MVPSLGFGTRIKFVETTLMLSSKSRSVWAKSKYDNDAPGLAWWLPLWLHLADTAEVTRHLAANWLAPAIPDLIEREFARSASGLDPAAEFKALASWLAGIHDIGKATPAFSTKVGALDDRMRESGLQHGPIDPNERRQAPHGLTGQMIVEKWLRENRRWGLRPARALASVIGAHHGIPATTEMVCNMRGREHLLGDEEWSAVRSELLEMAISRACVADLLDEWSHRSWSEPFLVEICGLVIVSDWLASTEAYFPLCRLGDDGSEFLDAKQHQERVESGLAKIELPSPWRPRDSGKDADSLLRTRFDLPDGAKATAAQRLAVEEARSMELPGLMIVQEATGSGKTEAALLAAEVLAARTGRSGVLFALPTQTTTDAMFSRELDWLGHIEESYCDAGEPSAFAVQLQHGRAKLNEEARALRKTGYAIRDRLLGSLGGDGDPAADFLSSSLPAPRQIGLDEEDGLGTRTSSGGKGARGNREGERNGTCLRDEGTDADLAIMAWFSGRKKSMLADFVVTTIDHLLFASLSAPHLMLRHLGLSRKVVIVDEVHSYSTYMTSYLDRSLTWLAAYGVPVILLSATLSEARCSALADAYDRGLQLVSDSDSCKEKQDEVPDVARERAQEEGPMPFPCLVTSGESGTKVVAVEAEGRSSSVEIRRMDEGADVVALLNDTLSDGGCALVVRNTVRRAQETYEELREVFGDDVSLNHSRFTISDRLNKDADLLRRFGPPRKSPKRPERAIVVATQVVEQSLDVDFDLLVTDLAPIDLLIQRMGRLHRHQRRRPGKLERPVCYVDCLPLASDDEPEIDRGAKHIYGEKDLLLTAAALNKIATEGGEVHVPDDVRELIEAVYGTDPDVPAQWNQALAEASDKAEEAERKKEDAAKGYQLREPKNDNRVSLIDWLRTLADDSEERARAHVRDGEDSLEAILLEVCKEGGQESVRTLPSSQGFPNIEIPTDREPDRALARAMAISAVRLPPRFSNQSAIDRVIGELEGFYVDSWQANLDLRGQLFLLLNNGRAELDGVIIEYTSTTGLMEVQD